MPFAAAFAALPVDEIRERTLHACAALRDHGDGAMVFYREAAAAASDVWIAALAREFGEGT